MSELPLRFKAKSEDTQQQQYQQQQQQQPQQPASVFTRPRQPYDANSVAASSSSSSTRPKSDSHLLVVGGSALYGDGSHQHAGPSLLSPSSSSPLHTWAHQAPTTPSHWSFATPPQQPQYEHSLYLAAAAAAAAAASADVTPPVVSSFSPLLVLGAAQYPSVDGPAAPTPSALASVFAQPYHIPAVDTPPTATTTAMATATPVAVAQRQRTVYHHHHHHHYHGGQQHNASPSQPHLALSSSYPMTQQAAQHGHVQLHSPTTMQSAYGQPNLSSSSVPLHGGNSGDDGGEGSARTEAGPSRPPLQFGEGGSMSSGGSSSSTSGSSRTTTTLMSMLSRRCTVCGTSSSPEWRRDDKGRKSLCNACGLRVARTRSRALRHEEQAKMADEVARNSGVIPETMQRHIEVSREKKRAAAERVAAAKLARAANKNDDGGGGGGGDDGARHELKRQQRRMHSKQ